MGLGVKIGGIHFSFFGGYLCCCFFPGDTSRVYFATILLVVCVCDCGFLFFGYSFFGGLKGRPRGKPPFLGRCPEKDIPLPYATPQKGCGQHGREQSTYILQVLFWLLSKGCRLVPPPPACL